MSEQQLSGKTAFVTGGTAGIGLAVAHAYTFFASDASRYVTGQSLSVDGGLTAGVTPGVLRAVAAKLRSDAERTAAIATNEA